MQNHSLPSMSLQLLSNKKRRDGKVEHADLSQHVFISGAPRTEDAFSCIENRALGRPRSAKNRDRETGLWRSI